MGNELLIKIVAQLVPIYIRHTFLLPKTLCKKLNQMVAQYWWRNDLARKRSIRLTGKNYVNLKVREDWDSRIYMHLI